MAVLLALASLSLFLVSMSGLISLVAAVLVAGVVWAGVAWELRWFEMLRRVPTNAVAGVGLSVSVRPNCGGRLIALDFVSVGGRRDGHDLSPDQVEILIESLRLVLAEARKQTQETAATAAALKAAEHEIPEDAGDETPDGQPKADPTELDKSSGVRIAS